MHKFELSDLPQNAQIHFIGIGGISMSGLAQILLNNGFRVSGSDRQASHITDKLESLGVKLFIGHNADNIDGADLIVHTAAVHNNNPEIIAAKEKNIKVIDRAQCLGAVMHTYKNAVGISGTHGKTTTTSMLTHALVYAGADPTISLGGELDLIGGNIRLGNSDIFVTEACEYTNSFLKFYPTIAVITNIEEDHLDFFSGIHEIMESFHSFAELTGENGRVIACGDDDNIKKALRNSNLNIIYYGLSKKHDYYPKNIVYNAGFPQFDIFFKNEFICHVNLKVPGEHNIKNAIASIAVASELGISPEVAAKGIETYTGVKRRFEKKGEYNGAVIIDDYAHHPTEIKATLSSVSNFDYNKLICVFQPHTYSRTKTLWREFLEAFDDVDELLLLDIFAARETYDGITRSDELARQLSLRNINVKYMADFKSTVDYLKASLSDGDILFTMGAGDVYKIGDEILK